MQPIIYADTKTHFIIGDPIEHSLSPTIFNMLYAHYEMNTVCQTAHVPKGELATFLQTKDMLRFQALNITIPHKVDIIPYLNVVDPRALEFNSVNSIFFDDEGCSHGYSTDAQGFSLSLQNAGESFANKHVMILGAGGAAAPLAMQSVFEHAASMTILARRKEAALDLCQRIHDMGFKNCRADELKNAHQYADKITLLINTTPLGMHNFPDDFTNLAFIDALPDNATVCDIVYNPSMTSLLTYAHNRGLKTVGGIGMLIWQAFAAFEKYYGTMPSANEIPFLIDLFNKQGLNISL